MFLPPCRDARGQRRPVPGQGQPLVARRRAGDDFDPCLRHPPSLGQQGDQGRVGLAALGRRGDGDLEGGRARRVRHDGLDPIAPGARRQPDGDFDTALCDADRTDSRAAHRKTPLSDVVNDQPLQEHDQQEEDDRQQIDPAQIGQEAPDRAQHRLGRPVQEVVHQVDEAGVGVDHVEGDQPAHDHIGQHDIGVELENGEQEPDDRVDFVHGAPFLFRVKALMHLRETLAAAPGPRKPRHCGTRGGTGGGTGGEIGVHRLTGREGRTHYPPSSRWGIPARMSYSGAVAQLGERRVRNAKVRGSIPLGSTKFDEGPASRRAFAYIVHRCILF